jgi:hypothetical protein
VLVGEHPAEREPVLHDQHGGDDERGPRDGRGEAAPSGEA